MLCIHYNIYKNNYKIGWSLDYQQKIVDDYWNLSTIQYNNIDADDTKQKQTFKFNLVEHPQKCGS